MSSFTNTWATRNINEGNGGGLLKFQAYRPTIGTRRRIYRQKLIKLAKPLPRWRPLSRVIRPHRSSVIAMLKGYPRRPRLHEAITGGANSPINSNRQS